MKKIVVLGAGLVGKAIAIDLSKSHLDITSVDINAKALKELNEEYSIKTIKLDVANKALLSDCLTNFDFVVCAVPGFMGYKTLETIIGAGKDVVDISFSPEDMLALDSLAKEKNVTAIVDCGVAPGMSNLFLGYYNKQMQIDTFECYVGGLPKVRQFPFEYKAPFSPIDVIEEYTRPARYIENTHLVTRDALTDPELMTFDKVGTLEAFNTDGLRSILFTMPHIPNMKEKTLRYPGHINIIRTLKAAGFFDTNKIKVGENEISPLDFTARMLMDNWKLTEKDDEFTVMRVSMRGTMDGQKKEITYHLYDEKDKKEGTSSMARTTGYTCTAATHLVLNNHFNEKGVFPPELITSNSICFDFMLDYLQERDITYIKEEKLI